MNLSQDRIREIAMYFVKILNALDPNVKRDRSLAEIALEKLSQTVPVGEMEAVMRLSISQLADAVTVGFLIRASKEKMP